MKAVLKKMKLQKFVPKKYGQADIYPMDGGFVMSFLDDSTLLFADPVAIRVALDTQNGQVMSLDTNGDMADMMSNVDSSPVWSILDQAGTQNAVRAAIGDLIQVRRLRKPQETPDGLALHHGFQQRRDLRSHRGHFRLHHCRHAVWGPQVDFDGKEDERLTREKIAVENTTVDSDGSNVAVHFKASDQQFQSLMHSDLFAAMTH